MRRKTQQQVVKGTALESTTRAWTNEALALVFLATALFLAISLLSFEYHRFDGSPEFAARANFMGPVGHFVGTLMSGFMGWGAFALIFWLAGIGFYIWNNERWESTLRVESKGLVLVGFVSALILACTLASIFWGRTGGGSVGMLVSGPLIMLFSKVGAALITAALILFSFSLSMRQSVAAIILHATWLVFSTVAEVVLHFCAAVLATVGFLGGVAAVIGRGISALFSRREGEAVEEESLPTPKRRKTQRTKEKDDWELGEQKAAEKLADKIEVEKELPLEERYSHVVVSRRQPESLGSEREKERALKKLQKAQKEQAEQAVVPDENPYASYLPPDLALLTRGEASVGAETNEELLQKSGVIENKLKDFGILGRVTQVHPGPVVTLFEFEPAPGVRVGKVTSLQDDLAMSLRASSIRVLAPIPKKGTVGIEVPNKQRDIVRLRDLLESEEFITADSSLMVPIGKDTYGDPVVADIATMPHLLMAGATGTGKSVCINALLVSLLYRASPADLGLILIDPKILELSVYEGIPHLRVPVVTVPRQAKAVLDWAVKEMESRYRMMQRYGVRSVDGYNKIARGEADSEGEVKKPPVEELVELPEQLVVEEGTVDAAPAAEPVKPVVIGEKLKPLPKIVIVIDELADLMLAVGREIEELITRLAQKARAAGIHLIVATQRPSVDVITGLIKANFPARLSFRVSSRIDSRTILDSMGADKLLGRGDMLLMLPGAVHLRRVHGAFVSDSEVKRVIADLKDKCPPQYDQRIMDLCEKALEEERNGGNDGEGGEIEYDSMYDKAVELVMEKGQASTSMIQRVFRIGYNRAARIIETMEREGLIGPMDGAKPREVLVPTQEEQLGGVKSDKFE